MTYLRNHRALMVSLFLFVLFIVGLGYWFIALRPANYKIDVSQTAVIKEMRELNRFETASFTIEKIIEAGTNDNAFSEFLFGDRVLLIAHGEVVAGFNLASLKEDAITIKDNEIRAELPAPEILFVRIDNHKTRVYDRDQGILTKGDKDLEAQARQAAEEEIRKAACEANILDQAAGNARKQFTALFSTLGFKKIILIIPEARC
jgi:hypothetical protein